MVLDQNHATDLQKTAVQENYLSSLRQRHHASRDYTGNDSARLGLVV